MIGGAGEERSNELWSLMLQAVNEHKKISKQEVEVWRRREREEGERMEEENSATLDGEGDEGRWAEEHVLGTGGRKEQGQPESNQVNSPTQDGRRVREQVSTTPAVMTVSRLSQDQNRALWPIAADVRGQFWHRSTGRHDMCSSLISPLTRSRRQRKSHGSHHILQSRNDNGKTYVT